MANRRQTSLPGSNPSYPDRQPTQTAGLSAAQTKAQALRLKQRPCTAPQDAGYRLPFARLATLPRKSRTKTLCAENQNQIPIPEETPSNRMRGGERRPPRRGDLEMAAAGPGGNPAGAGDVGPSVTDSMPLPTVLRVKPGLSQYPGAGTRKAAFGRTNHAWTQGSTIASRALITEGSSSCEPSLLTWPRAGLCETDH